MISPVYLHYRTRCKAWNSTICRDYRSGLIVRAARLLGVTHQPTLEVNAAVAWVFVLYRWQPCTDSTQLCTTLPCHCLTILASSESVMLVNTSVRRGVIRPGLSTKRRGLARCHATTGDAGVAGEHAAATAGGPVHGKPR